LTALPLGGGAVGFTRLIGTDMRAEILTAGELGYRALLAPRVSLDLAAYEGRYTHVRVVAPGAPFLETSPAPDHMVFPLYFVNGYHARTRGLEGGLDWRPGPRFHLTVSHTVFWMRLDPDAGVVANPDVSAHDAPTYQLAVRPHLMLAPRLGFDATWYHVDDVPAQRAPAYDRLDAQLSWRTPAGFELTAGVQNVFHDRDLEFVSTSGTNTPTTVRTGAYGKVTWRP
jgi:outer membrane receptor protein involved in Fe transport